MAGKAEKTFVAGNNHPRGQAAANAVELKSLLIGKKVKAPEPLVRTYPELQEYAIPESMKALLVSPETSEKAELDELQRRKLSLSHQNVSNAVQAMPPGETIASNQAHGE